MSGLLLDNDGIYFGDDEPIEGGQVEPHQMQSESEARAELSIRSLASIPPQDSETTRGVAQQRTIKARLVPIDDPTELPNQTLGDWNDGYLEFMDEAHLDSANKISLAQAKRNAAFWVLDQGIGAVDTEFRADVHEHPLSIFSGRSLLDALVGPQAQPQGRKRSSSAMEEEAGDDHSRRVRSRSDEHTTPNRTEQQQPNDDDQGIVIDDYEVIFLTSPISRGALLTRLGH